MIGGMDICIYITDMGCLDFLRACRVRHSCLTGTTLKYNTNINKITSHAHNGVSSY